jgi:hypothetical protein
LYKLVVNSCTVSSKAFFAFFWLKIKFEFAHNDYKQ